MENRALMVVFYLISLFQPGFIIYCLISVSFFVFFEKKGKITGKKTGYKISTDVNNNNENDASNGINPD